MVEGLGGTDHASLKDFTLNGPGAKSYCPACNYGPLDAATSCHFSTGRPVRPTGPEPGMPTICLKCAALLVYDERLRSVWPTAEQLAALQADARLWEIIGTLRGSVLGLRR